MTDIQKVRLLVNDSGSTVFTDAEIQGFLDLSNFYSGNDQIYMAAALGCDARATRAASTGGVRIGDYSTNKGASTEFLAASQRYRDIVLNTPAFAVVEENLSANNAGLIVYNYFLRTLP